MEYKIYKCLNVFIVLYMLSSFRVEAQEIIGLWEIAEVSVGDEVMTPVAKWTRINEDGTYQSGNGWLQNSVGSWIVEKGSTSLRLVARNGIKDEFGSFTVKIIGNNMSWEREEEGMNVVVSLKRVKDLPIAPADNLQGLWDLVESVVDGESTLASYDPDGKYYIFIRWDRIYVERTAKGQRSTGYWHINGHRPHLTLMSHDENKNAESWRIEVTDEKLTMTGISDSNKDSMLVFNRLEAFPD